MGLFEFSGPQLHDTTFSPTGLYFNTNDTSGDLEDSSGNSRTLTEKVAPTSLSSSQPYVSPIRSYSGGEYQTTDSSFHALGAISVACMMMITGSRTQYADPARDSNICCFGTVGSDEAFNVNYQYYLTPANNLASYHEHAGGTGEFKVSTYTFPLNEWFHLAITRQSDGITESVYVNGKFFDKYIFAAAPTGGTAGTCVFGLGTGPNPNFPNIYHNYHQMSSVAVYVGRHLSADEVAYLARRCLGR